MKKWYTFILVAATLYVCAAEGKEEWINIFVHGAVALRSNLSFDLIKPLLTDAIEGTRYEKNVVHVRPNRYLFTMQAIQDLGLRPIKRNSSSPPGAYAFATLFDRVLKQCQAPGIKNSYYTFGWTGLISYKRRYKEARIFYKQIKELLAKAHAQGRKPKVRILAYSHGANLTLNLTSVRAREFPRDTFCIDEAILLGMPVSIRTMNLVKLPLFKQIYHLYSKSDIVQLLDITVPGHRPARIFNDRAVPQTLTQIEVRVCAKELKNPCTSRSSRSQPVNQSPGHFEFWFFGWAPHYYRSTLRIYPLPFGVLAPLVICAARKGACHSRNVIVDIRLENDCALVSDKCLNIRNTVPFISCKELVTLQEKAISFHPGQPKYRDGFLRLQSTINPDAYK